MRSICYIMLFLAGLMLSQYISAQSNEDLFLLGTFSNYRGISSEREYIDTAACEVDHYNYHEKKLADYIYSSIARRYGGEVRMKKIPNRYHLYSRPQFLILDSLYTQSRGLRIDIFSTRDEALSYLHGVYLRFGRPVNDTLYSVRVHNSNHGRFFAKISQPLGFSDVKVEELNTIPHTTVVYFKPMAEFLEFIRPTEKLKKKLSADEEKFRRKMLGMSKKEFEELKKKSR